MAQINLLPWRAERRKQREREFYGVLATAAVAAVVAVLAGIWIMDARISDQQDRNAYLQGQIKDLDKKIEQINELDRTRSKLLTRKEIIEQLQANRSQMVHLFDELVKTIPDGTRLTSMKQQGEMLTLEGVAESNARVASYMRNLDVSPWMGRSDLRKIENKSDGKGADRKLPYVFSLDVKLRKPEETQDEETGAATAVASAPATAPVAPAAPDLGEQLNGAATKLMTKPAAEAPAASATAPGTSKPANAEVTP